MNLSLSKLWRQLRTHLLPSVAAAWMRVCVIIAFIFLLATGPSYQMYLIALVNGDSASIYESAYHSSIIKFPSLPDWFRATLDWPIVLAAITIVTCSFRSRSYRKIVESIGITTFLTLTILDAGTLSVSGQLSASTLFENVVANMLGGVALGLASALMLVNCEYMARTLSGRTASVAAGASAIAFGVLVSTAAYYMLDLFYRPLPVRISTVLSPSAHGALAIDGAAIGSNETSDRPRFSLVPSVSTGGYADWHNGDGNVTVRWSALPVPAKFDASVTMFGGCSDRLKLPKVLQAYELPNVRHIDFWVDTGLLNVSVFGTQDASSGAFRFLPNFAFFSTEKNTKDGTFGLTEFIKEKSTLAYEGSEGMAYYALVVPYVIEGNSVLRRSNVLHLKADGTETKISLLSGSPKRRGDNSPGCKQLAISPILSRGSLDMSGLDFLGVLIEFTPHESNSYLSATHSIEVDGENGWVTVGGLTSDELSQAPSGRADGIFVRGGIARIDVNGGAEATTSADSLDAIGEFEGGYDTLGQLRFDGIANLLWRNRVRANPTKWESLDSEQHTYLIAFMVTCLTFASSLIVLRWKKSDEFYL